MRSLAAAAVLVLTGCSGADCAALAQQYRVAFAAGQGCTPAGGNECSATVASSIDKCTCCAAAVTPASAVHLNELAQQARAAGCEPINDDTCVSGATSTACIPDADGGGHCED
jgi:hypothetical protein